MPNKPHYNGCRMATRDGPCDCKDIHAAKIRKRIALTEEWGDELDRHPASVYNQCATFEKWVIRKLAGILDEHAGDDTNAN